MKQRVISAAVGIVLLVIVLSLYDTPVLTAALACITAIAVYEVLVSTHYLPTKSGGVLCALFAGASVFMIQHGEALYLPAVVLFVAVLIGCALKFHRQFSFQQLTVCVFTATAIPLAFSTILMMDGIIYLILTCIAAWVTDMGAFFVGRAFGKRKLAPEISPYKTVEGAIGGLACAGIIFPAVCYGYWHFSHLGAGLSLSHAVLIGVVCAVTGMMGDLFASVIKRQTGIKDFGKIMPGHGGVMDRFDSFLFVAPTLYFLSRLFPIFTI